MRRLAVNLATTFVDNAMRLRTGFGQAVLHLATAPIRRIANACDVGTILTKRRAARRVNRKELHMSSRHRPRLLGRISPFRHLSHLT